MKTFNLDRVAIRKALQEYKETQRQKEAILKDTEIQSFYNNDEIEKARKLIKERYSKADSEKQTGIRLIETMSRNIAEWKDIDPNSVYMNYVVFKKMLDIAERV